jgi:hypothetical protein
LVEVNPVEGEVFIVNRIQSSSHHSGLHLVLLLRQQLELHVGVAENKKEESNSFLAQKST